MMINSTKRSLVFALLLALSPALSLPTSVVRVQAAQKKQIEYVCPMDPDVKSRKPGKCPKCGMNLREADSTANNEAAGKSASTSQQASDSLPGAPEAKGKTKTPAEAAAAYFPNLPLLTQDNKPVRFFDDLLKDKTVMINFVFTTCTGVCPPMTANLAKVQEYLGDRVGRDVNMITISVDPTVDTPAEMKKYADKFKVKPGWYFLTGKKENVDQVLYKLGGYVEDKLQHSSVLIIGNVGTGEFMKMLAMAKPSDIADQVLKVAGPAK